MSNITWPKASTAIAAIEIGPISLSVLLISLIVVWLNHILANTRDRAKERRSAGSVVVEAFRPELDALLQSNQDCGLILTDTAYLRHESAVRNLLPKLSWCNRIFLHCAWLKLAFHQQDQKGSIPFYEQYADYGSLTQRRHLRPIVIERISRIVKLAQK